MLDEIKKKIFKFQKSHLVLTLLFIVYLVFNIQLPRPLASLVDTTLGNVVVVVAALSLFYSKNNVLAVLGVIVAYEIIRRSSGVYGLINSVPTQANKDRLLEKFNEDNKNYTLEEEMVSNILPLVSGSVMPPKYEPVLDNLYSATSV